MIFPVHIEQMDADSCYFQQRMDNLHVAESSYSKGSEDSSDYPVRLNFQTNYTCNARCIMCPYERPFNGAPVMNIGIFDKIADECFPYLSEISTTDMGEPLMLPWFRHLCDKLTEYELFADVVTNGSLIDETFANLLVRNAYDIKVSYDGITADMFESIRKHCPKDRVDRGLDLLIAERDRIKPVQDPTVTIQTSLLKRNIHQLSDIVQNASDIGADRVKAYYVISYSKDVDEEVLAGDDEMYLQYVDDARDIARRCGIVFEVAESTSAAIEVERVRCTTAWYQAWVDYDGMVYPCHSHEGYSVGNINETVRHIWNSDRYHRIRKASSEYVRGTPCHLCGMLYSQKMENTKAPYDRDNFLSTNSLDRCGDGVRWSNRSRLFDKTL